MPKEADDIITGYTNKVRREGKNLRKAAYLILLPHVKKLSERQFNRDVWPIDEQQMDPETFRKENIERMQKAVREHNLKLGEQRRKKSEK